MIRQHRLPLDMIEPPRSTPTLHRRTQYVMSEIEKLDLVREMARITCNGKYAWMAAAINMVEVMRQKGRVACR